MLKSNERKLCQSWSANSRSPEPYFTTEFGEAPGRFSPDSRYVAYRSEISGRKKSICAARTGVAMAPVSADGLTICPSPYDVTAMERVLIIASWGPQALSLLRRPLRSC